jgi:hypothetical protein
MARHATTKAFKKLISKLRQRLNVYSALLAVVVAAIFITYLVTLRFDFVYDDLEQIVNNRYVHSWQYVPRFFTEHVWGHMNPNGSGTYYRPVFMLWLLINHSLFGLDPLWWHLTTVLLHVVATLAVYKLASRLTADRLTACIAAMVFGLHPVHVEGVAWVSGVTEPLLAVLLIPSFICYLNKREHSQQSNKWLILSLVLYGLAMLTKETALVLPILVMAHECIFGCAACKQQGMADMGDPGEGNSGGGPSMSGTRRAWGCFVVSTPYLALTAFYLMARVAVLKGLGHPLTPLPVITTILTWPSLLWFYIKLLIWPVGLSVLYDTPYVYEFGIGSFVLPLAAVFMVIALLIYWSKKSPAARTGCLWLALPILPVLNISAFYWSELAHDRYLYLPSVGFSIIVAIALRKVRMGRARLFGQSASCVILILTLACLLKQATAYQLPYWANNLEIYSRGVSIAPNNILAKTNLAITMSRRGQFHEAIKLHRQVFERNPHYWLANFNLGYCYYEIGELEIASQYLNRAIEINPTDSKQFIGLGLIKKKMGRLDEAVAAMRHAIQLNPEGFGYHYELGCVMKKQSDSSGALREFKAEVALNSEHSAARQQLLEIESQFPVDATRK